MKLSTVSDKSTQSRPVTNFSVSNLTETYSLDVEKALISNLLSTENEIPPQNEDLQNFDHLKIFEVNELENKSIGVLLDAKYAHSFCTQTPIIGNSDEPIGLITKFGLALIGPKFQPSVNINSAIAETINFENIMSFTVDDMTLVDMINTMFRMDFISRFGESFPAEQVFPSVNDNIALKQFEDTTHYDPICKRWTIGLPWRLGREKTAEIFSKINFLRMAHNRHMKFGEKLERDPVLKAGSFKQMNMTIADDHIRVLDSLEAPIGHPVCYLPNLVVVKPNKPGKFRICQDAAAKVGVHSLNHYLFSGPDLLNKLITVIMRFRQKRYTLSADISNFFYQIKIDPRDASALRYLWWTDETLRQIVIHESTRHIFGIKSSPTIANYILKRHAELFKDRMTIETFLAILLCFYVDDLLTSTDTVEEATNLKAELICILELGGFHLTKWKSNIPELCDNYSATNDIATNQIPISSHPQVENRMIVHDQPGHMVGDSAKVPGPTSPDEVAPTSASSTERFDARAGLEDPVEPLQHGMSPTIESSATELADKRNHIGMNPTNENPGDELRDNQFKPGMSPETEQIENKITKEQNLVGMSPTPLTMLTNNTTSNVNFADKDHSFPATDVCSRRVGVPTQLDNNSTEDLVMSEEEDETANLSPLEMVRFLSDSKWESEMLKGVTEGEHSILGVGYCFEKDEMNVSIREKADSELKTKRDLLSFIAGVYDPCGFIAPWCLEGRNLFQKINSPKIPYKSDLPPDIKEAANKWVKSINLLKMLKISRWTNPLGLSDSITEICIFCDASKIGYGLVIYMRKSVKGATDSSQISVSFLLSKSHVVPSNMNLNPTKDAISHGDSIPRLELVAAKAAAQWRDYFSREILDKIDKFFLFTDSLTILNWLWDFDKRFKCFENFRIKAIRSLSELSEWRHVPTKDNPADLCSKGIKSHETKKWSFLHSGPLFLLLDYSNWPPARPIKSLKSTPLEADVSAINVITMEGTLEDPIVDVVQQEFDPWPIKVSAKTDCWSKKLRLICCVVKVIQTLRQRVENKKNNILPTRLRPRKNATKDKLILHFTEDERDKAESLLINAIQSISFEKEMVQLAKLGIFSEKALGELKLKNSKVTTLSPFLDSSNVMRAGGRIAKAEFLPYDTRFPIILPNHNTPEIRSLIRHYHTKNFHTTIKQTHYLLRQKYFILGGKTSVNSVLSSCLLCQRMTKQPSKQKEGDLPFDRLAVIAPFTNCGIDAMGPFHLKHKLRGTKKQFVLIACCMSTRAVCLMPLRDMTSSAVINALIKIHAQYPALKRIYSDNGSNFVGADREIRDAMSKWNKAEINKDLEQHQLEWIFGPAYCGSAGGAWERLVGMCKKLIRAVVGQQNLDLDDFECLLCGASSIMNQRPLTAASADVNDTTALSPAHFLYPYLFVNANHLIPPLPPGDEGDLQSGWRSSQRLLNHFWEIYQREYITDLLRRKKDRSDEPINVGDLVIVVDDQESREYWKLARVTSILNNDLSHPRRFLLRTKNNKMIDRNISSCIKVQLPT